MTLWELPPNVRPSDPDTSRAAAVLGRTSIRERVRLTLVAHPDGLTDWELTAALGEPAHRKASIGKRRQECGAIDTGRRRLSPLGCEAIVWTLNGAA
jgi:hypothetical protein